MICIIATTNSIIKNITKNADAVKYISLTSLVFFIMKFATNVNFLTRVINIRNPLFTQHVFLLVVLCLRLPFRYRNVTAIFVDKLNKF